MPRKTGQPVATDASIQPGAQGILDRPLSRKVATQGITVASFPAGTIFSVRLNPLRDGSNFGSRVGALAKCPKAQAPMAGKHCDSVEGSELLGGTTF